jgi:hypothetical protein
VWRGCFIEENTSWQARKVGNAWRPLNGFCRPTPSFVCPDQATGIRISQSCVSSYSRWPICITQSLVSYGQGRSQTFHQPKWAMQPSFRTMSPYTWRLHCHLQQTKLIHPSDPWSKFAALSLSPEGRKRDSYYNTILSAS